MKITNHSKKIKNKIKKLSADAISGIIEDKIKRKIYNEYSRPVETENCIPVLFCQIITILPLV